MYFDLSDYQFPFFSQISASTVSKQITRNHFGLNFEADSDRTVFRVLPKNQSAVRMIHFSSLMSVLLLQLLTSVAERAGCDDAECLDEKQVFVQLRSELQHIHAGVGGVATVASVTILTTHMVPPALPAPLPEPFPAALPAQFAMSKAFLARTRPLFLLPV